MFKPIVALDLFAQILQQHDTSGCTETNVKEIQYILKPLNVIQLQGIIPTTREKQRKPWQHAAGTRFK